MMLLCENTGEKMFCVHEVVAPLCVTLALPIHLTVVGLRPRANWHSHPWCNPGGTGSPATLCYKFGAQCGAQGLALG